jgi:hypothetical protein
MPDDRKKVTWAELALWQKVVAVVFLGLVAAVATMVIVSILLLLVHSLQVLWELVQGE